MTRARGQVRRCPRPLSAVLLALIACGPKPPEDPGWQPFAAPEDSSPTCEPVEGPSECADFCGTLDQECGIHYNICEPLPWEDAPQVRCTRACVDCLESRDPCFSDYACVDACPCLVWVIYD